eukprot:TRINITY_DN86_c0_g1_i1.p1 TRINITY_DN86_c0_g1~~TRINITY_DN86_c0_g1_i1.p1  ORF type:complete len:152 (-),score=32.78 TRINITY_DN86_c0_g1_i1:323-778(-)
MLKLSHKRDREITAEDEGVLSSPPRVAPKEKMGDGFSYGHVEAERRSYEPIAKRRRMRVLDSFGVRRPYFDSAKGLGHDYGFQPAKNGELYHAEEVNEIVQKALREQEERLRVEYERVLAEKLHEQFEQFSTFSKEYISRNYKDTDLSYFS